MLKKMVILAVVGFVAIAAIGGTKLASYIESKYRAAEQAVAESIPPEEEIARLKTEINLLDKDVKTLVNQLAKERVEVNQLKGKVDEMAAMQSGEKERINARAVAIKTAEKDSLQTVSFGNRSLNVATAKTELEVDVKRYTNAQKSLVAHEALLTNRIKIRDSIEKQLEATKNQKSELAGAVEEMEAELALLKLQQTESKYQTDDTRLAKIKEDLRKLRTRVEVKREELKITQTTLDDVPATTGNGKSVDDILAPLNGPAKKPESTKIE